MGIQRANSEAVAIAWLKTVPGIPSTMVGTTLPQDNTIWAASGFVQPIVTGGNAHMYYSYRAPVITAHCWAVKPNSGKPPWGKAVDLAESIMHELESGHISKENFSLGITGAPDVRILEVCALREPRRIPWGFPSGQGSFIDPADSAHYTIDFQMYWSEIPA